MPGPSLDLFEKLSHEQLEWRGALDGKPVEIGAVAFKTNLPVLDLSLSVTDANGARNLKGTFEGADRKWALTFGGVPSNKTTVRFKTGVRWFSLWVKLEFHLTTDKPHLLVIEADLPFADAGAVLAAMAGA